jgi:hypothetical protein
VLGCDGLLRSQVRAHDEAEATREELAAILRRHPEALRELLVDGSGPWCVVHRFSSRMCERGTAGCVVKHEDPAASAGPEKGPAESGAPDLPSEAVCHDRVGAGAKDDTAKEAKR